MASTGRAPKDGQVMTAILKDMGIIEFEPRVINQLLEFTYRYVTNILEDARVFSSHSKKKNVDVDDVKLAIQMQMDKSFTTPPPRDILIDISRVRNNMPLPLIKPHCGPRLPPDRYCLSSCNYRMKASKKSRQMSTSFGSFTAPKINLNTVQSGVTGKLGPAINLTSKTGQTMSLVTKGGSNPTVNIVTRPTPSAPVPIIKLEKGLVPSPIIKLTTSSAAPVSSSGSISASLMGNVSIVSAASLTTTTSAVQFGSSTSTQSTPSVIPKIQTVTRIAEPASVSSASLEVTPMNVTEASLKRKREPDEDYDV